MKGQKEKVKSEGVEKSPKPFARPKTPIAREGCVVFEKCASEMDVQDFEPPEKLPHPCSFAGSFSRQVENLDLSMNLSESFYWCAEEV